MKITANQVLKMLSKYNYKDESDFQIIHSKLSLYSDSEYLHLVSKENVKNAQITGLHKKIKTSNGVCVLFFNFVYNKDKLQCIDVYLAPRGKFNVRVKNYGVKLNSIQKGKYQVLKSLINTCLKEIKNANNRWYSKNYRERQKEKSIIKNCTFDLSQYF